MEYLVVSLLVLSNALSVAIILLLLRHGREADRSDMRVAVTELQYWKSEYSKETCEDAYAWATDTGRFAIADGVGTASFADIWARILVDHFVRTTPLLSNDPFEVEWWLSGAQRKYQDDEATSPDRLDPAYREKAREGSHATLAALRVKAISNGTATADVLAIGDSCVFHMSAHGSLRWSFPLTTRHEFTSAPVCLPTQNFRRSFHTVHRPSGEVELRPGEAVVLATDAVAEWVLAGEESAGSGAEDRLRHIIGTKAHEEWQQLVESERACGNMRDDDSSAIVIELLGDSPSVEGAALGISPSLSRTVSEERYAQVKQARESGDNIELARVIGDYGCWTTEAELSERLGIDTQAVRKARETADAFVRMLDVIRANLNSPEKVGPLWRRHSSLLLHEPGAQQLVASLRALGIEQGTEQPQRPTEITTDASGPLASTDTPGNPRKNGGAPPSIH